MTSPNRPSRRSPTRGWATSQPPKRSSSATRPAGTRRSTWPSAHSTPSELFLHRFVAITKSGQTLDGYLSYFPQNGWWILQDADNLTTVIKPDANGNPTLNTELFRSINVLKETR